MFALSDSIRPFFERAGWAPGRSQSGLPISPTQVALALLDQFGGLAVGSTGSGREMARSDISFFTELKPEVHALLRPWHGQTGAVEAVANAHHDHMILFVGAQGFYAFTDPDGQLYHLDADFSPAMEKLLLGLALGASMARGQGRSRAPRR